MARLATHEIVMHDNLARLIAEAETLDRAPGSPDAQGEDRRGNDEHDDPLSELQGLTALVTAALRQAGPHDAVRLERAMARETSRLAQGLVEVIMAQRHLTVVPGNEEPWGTEVDQLLVRGGSLLPGNQGTRIRVHASTGAMADIPRRQLERVLVNLVYRAWRSSPPPSPITLSSRVRPGAVEILVEDVGPALPEEEALGLFEQTGRGLLGMSVVKDLVCHAGGSVRYERVADSNRVAVRLPLAGAPRLIEGQEPALSPV
jgi:signal transduction histidine kinase